MNLPSNADSQWPAKHRAATAPERCPACGSRRVLPIADPAFMVQESDLEGRPKYVMREIPEKCKSLNDIPLWACETCTTPIFLPLVTCPSCGSHTIVGVSFGYPTQETLDAAARGETVLGGCYLRGDERNQLGCAQCCTVFARPR